LEKTEESSKIIKGSCCVVSEAKMFLLEEATSKTASFLITEGA